MTLMTGLKKSGNFFLLFLPLLMTLGLIQALVVQGLADDPSNDENSPVKSGYAIVTPSLVGGLATDTDKYLVVFETFGQQRGQDAAQACVLPASLSTDFLLFVSASGRLSRNLGVAIANPGEVPAHAELTLLDEEGSSLFPPATATIDLEPRHQSSRFVTEIFGSHPLPQDFTGTLRISSNTPIAVIGLRFRGINFSTIPATPTGPISNVPEIALDGGMKIGGNFATILPQFATGGGWASEIILINSGTADLDVRVDLFDKVGDPLEAVFNGVAGHTFDKSTFPKMVIPPGGVFVLSPRDKNGDSEF
jgi:hypothetical protein